jgi:hypothetical protein
MSAETQHPEKKKTPLWIPIVIGVLIVGFINSLFDSGEEDAVVEPETVAEEQAAEEPTVEEEPAEPTSFATLAELEAAISAEFGGMTNMDLPRDLSIEFEEEDGWLNVSYVLDENFTVGLTRSGAWSDIHRIFELARKADFVKELTVASQFPLINNLGEELGPQNVVVAYFDPEVYPRVNLENIRGEALYDAATQVMIHQAFQD